MNPQRKRRSSLLLHQAEALFTVKRFDEASQIYLRLLAKLSPTPDSDLSSPLSSLKAQSRPTSLPSLAPASQADGSSSLSVAPHEDISLLSSELPVLRSLPSVSKHAFLPSDDSLPQSLEHGAPLPFFRHICQSSPSSVNPSDSQSIIPSSLIDASSLTDAFSISAKSSPSPSPSSALPSSSSSSAFSSTTAFDLPSAHSCPCSLPVIGLLRILAALDRHHEIPSYLPSLYGAVSLVPLPVLLAALRLLIDHAELDAALSLAGHFLSAWPRRSFSLHEGVVAPLSDDSSLRALCRLYVQDILLPLKLHDQARAFIQHHNPADAEGLLSLLQQSIENASSLDNNNNNINNSVSPFRSMMSTADATLPSSPVITSSSFSLWNDMTHFFRSFSHRIQAAIIPERFQKYWPLCSRWLSLLICLIFLSYCIKKLLSQPTIAKAFQLFLGKTHPQ